MGEIRLSLRTPGIGSGIVTDQHMMADSTKQEKQSKIEFPNQLKLF